MDNTNYSVIVEGLDKIDCLALRDEINETAIDIKVRDENEHRFGEPGTVIAIAVIGHLALPPLLLWLARHKRGFKAIEKTIVELPDGTKVERVVTIDVTGSWPPSSETIEKLTRFYGVSLEGFRDLLSK